MKHHIRLLEETLLRAEVRGSAEKMASFLSEDFFEFGSSGKTYDKKAVLNALPLLKPTKMRLDDFLIIAEKEALIVCSYRLLIEALPHSFRTSVWIKNQNQWQMRFHQSSKI